MEKLYFPKDSYYLTQGYGKDSYSHAGRKALDVSAAGGGNYKIYAPFSGYVAKKYVTDTSAYTIWLVSNEKVLCADGNTYYICAMLLHPKEIKNISVGQTFKQGNHLMNDGDTGRATGKHLDFEIAVYDNKETIKANWYKNSYGKYGLYNAVNPCDYMMLKIGTTIKKEIYDGKTYHFLYENELENRDIKEDEKENTKKYEKGLYKAVANVRVRVAPSKKARQKYVREMSKDGQKHATSKSPNALARYKTGTLFDALDIIYNSKTDIWAKTYSGYVNIIDGKYQNSDKA